MKLTEQELLELFTEKGITCRSIESYKNLTEPMDFICSNKHEFCSTVQAIRSSRFKCPHCVGAESRKKTIRRLIVPEKCGYRVVGIDNATNNIGLSIFDDGKLSFYSSYSFDGETHDRITKNRNFIVNTVLAEMKPDFVILEDIQQQANVNTFKTLSMLLGSTITALKNGDTPFETTLSVVWRNHFQIKGKTRIEKKAAAIKLVETMYQLKVNDDIAEAILLGKYAVDMLNKAAIKKLF